MAAAPHPNHEGFFPLFAQAGHNAEAATTLLDRLMREWPDTSSVSRGQIKELEEEGDRITHDILHQLHSTAVTPIDREDIHALAAALDDVVDLTEETADVMGLYKIEAPMEQAVELTAILRDAGAGVAAALDKPGRPVRPWPPTWPRSTGWRTRATGSAARRWSSLFAGGHRPDGRDPLEGRVRASRAGHRRVRAGGAPARGHRRQAVRLTRFEQPAMVSRAVYGCIDIGSNTTRLLVAEVSAGRVRALAARRIFTRIGASVGADGAIAAEKVVETAQVAGALAAEAAEMGAERMALLGTAAVREAANGDELRDGGRGGGRAADARAQRRRGGPAVVRRRAPGAGGPRWSSAWAWWTWAAARPSWPWARPPGRPAGRRRCRWAPALLCARHPAADPPSGDQLAAWRAAAAAALDGGASRPRGPGAGRGRHGHLAAPPDRTAADRGVAATGRSSALCAAPRRGGGPATWTWTPSASACCPRGSPCSRPWSRRLGSEPAARPRRACARASCWSWPARAGPDGQGEADPRAGARHPLPRRRGRRGVRARRRGVLVRRRRAGPVGHRGRARHARGHPPAARRAGGVRPLLPAQEPRRGAGGGQGAGRPARRAARPRRGDRGAGGAGGAVRPRRPAGRGRAGRGAAGRAGGGQRDRGAGAGRACTSAGLPERLQELAEAARS